MILHSDGSAELFGMLFVRAVRRVPSTDTNVCLEGMCAQDGEPLFAIPGGRRVRQSQLPRVAQDIAVWKEARCRR